MFLTPPPTNSLLIGYLLFIIRRSWALSGKGLEVLTPKACLKSLIKTPHPAIVRV